MAEMSVILAKILLFGELILFSGFKLIKTRG